jgi:two-component system response regulator HydG
VREPQNVVKYAAALATAADVAAGDLPDEIGGAPAPDTRAAAPAPEVMRTLADLEREDILRVLDACGGSQARAAGVLGVARNTLWRKLRSYS